MTHSSTYLAYAAWLAPVMLPIILSFAWSDRLSRKVPFVVVGTLAGIGVVVLSMIPFAILLGWLNRVLGMDAREQWESRVWFNGILSLAFNLVVGYLAMVFLERWLRKGNRTSEGAADAD